MLRRQLLKTRITTSTTTVIRLRTNFAPSITISTIGTAATGTAVITGVLQFTAGTPPSTEAIIIHGATPGIIPITPEHIQVHSATTGVIPGIMAGDTTITGTVLQATGVQAGVLHLHLDTHPGSGLHGTADIHVS